MIRLSVGTWDPSYDGPLAPATEPPEGVDVDVEVERHRWAPITPPAAGRPDRVLFIDGVRRTDAALWATPEGAPRPRQALAASYAAGVVASTPTGATIDQSEVRRIIVGPAGIEPLDTGPGGLYQPVIAAEDPTAAQLSNTIQERLGLLEQHLAHQATAHQPADLVIIDGPLSGRQHIDGAIGYIKTHQVAYLDPSLEQVVADLDGGQRTPLFRTTGTGSGYSRLSFYLRLTNARAHPWDGIVRCEMTPEQARDAATSRANLVAATLPSYASEGHWDARAPQNLVPIAALERELRHHLGDQPVLERNLRRAV